MVLYTGYTSLQQNIILFIKGRLFFVTIAENLLNNIAIIKESDE